MHNSCFYNLAAIMILYIHGHMVTPPLGQIDLPGLSACPVAFNQC